MLENDPITIEMTKQQSREGFMKEYRIHSYRHYLSDFDKFVTRHTQTSETCALPTIPSSFQRTPGGVTTLMT
jgi:hypothetical protein